MRIGGINHMEVYKKDTMGYFLNDRKDEVLLPFREANKDLDIGDMVSVFIYHDEQGRPIATMKKPKINLASFAALKCVRMSRIGAFMDWGLSRDLLVPLRELSDTLEEEEFYLCYLFLDEEGRLTGTTKLNKVLDNSNIKLKEKDKVDIIIWEETRLGYKVVINQMHHGLVYHNEVYKNLFPGKRMKAYVKTIRPDNAIDVSLEKMGYAAVKDHVGTVLEALRSNDGVLYLHDKSDPAKIKDQLHISKKIFKKAIGTLYKQRKITIHSDRIELNKK